MCVCACVCIYECACVTEQIGRRDVLLRKHSLLQMKTAKDKRDRLQVVGNTDDEETDAMEGRRLEALAETQETGDQGAEKNYTESNS